VINDRRLPGRRLDTKIGMAHKASRWCGFGACRLFQTRILCAPIRYADTANRVV